MVLLPGCTCCGCTFPNMCSFTATASYEGLSVDPGQCSCNLNDVSDSVDDNSFPYASLISGWSTIAGESTEFDALIRCTNKIEFLVAVNGQYTRDTGSLTKQRLNITIIEEVTMGHYSYDDNYQLFHLRSCKVTYSDDLISVNRIVDYQITRIDNLSIPSSCDIVGSRSCATANSSEYKKYPETDPYILPSMIADRDIESFGQANYPTEFSYIQGVCEDVFDALEANPLTVSISWQQSCNPLP